ncbi:MAG: rhomboid family intramembrane serine protease [Thiobacillus sp.]|nr:rhomboid family intramembrane serine protease [Thiobacillus sp.]
MVWAGAGYWHTSNDVQLAWGANFGPATKDGEWWRLGSALFLHFGLFHLGMNMLSLWDGGRLVERMYGSGRFLLVYFASGLAGNLLSLIIQGDRAVSGGASGAIFGIYGALMVHLWLTKHRNESREHRQLLWGAALFSAFAILLGFTIEGIDNAAHIGGLLGGLLTGVVLARASNGDRVAPARSRWAAATLFSLWVVLMVGFMPQPRYRWSEEVQARGEIHAFIGEDARIAAQLEAILGSARQGASFDELAGRVESSVASPYADSFHSLSRLHLDPTAPSASALARVRQYAEERRDASLALAEGLRAKDWEQIREALEKVTQAGRQAGAKARSQSEDQIGEPAE